MKTTPNWKHWRWLRRLCTPPRLGLAPKAATTPAATKRAATKPAATTLAAPVPSTDDADRLSPLGSGLRRAIRRGVLRGEGDKAQAEAKAGIKRWQAAQDELGRGAVQSIEAVRGLPVERDLLDAVESVSRRRAAIHAKKPFFFDDAEALTRAIVAYVVALRAEHEAYERVWQARVKLSMFDTLGGMADADKRRLAEDELARALVGVSPTHQAQRRIDLAEAHLSMKEARMVMERDYYVAHFGPFETCPPAAYTAGGSQERNSDSNRVQLRPKSSGSPGRR